MGVGESLSGYMDPIVVRRESGVRTFMVGQLRRRSAQRAGGEAVARAIEASRGLAETDAQTAPQPDGGEAEITLTERKHLEPGAVASAMAQRDRHIAQEQLPQE